MKPPLFATNHHDFSMSQRVNHWMPIRAVWKRHLGSGDEPRREKKNWSGASCIKMRCGECGHVVILKALEKKKGSFSTLKWFYMGLSFHKWAVILDKISLILNVGTSGHFCVGCRRNIPICSMVLVYMLTWMGYIDGIHVTINIGYIWILSGYTESLIQWLKSSGRCPVVAQLILKLMKFTRHEEFEISWGPTVGAQRGQPTS